MTITATASSEDNVFVSVHDIDHLRDEYPQWDVLSRREKLRIARGVEPIEEHSSSNVTCVGLHEAIVDNLNVDTGTKIEAAYLAVGTGNTAPSTSNTTLNTEYDRFAVTDGVDNGSTLKSSTFLDSTEANAGSDLVEVGLMTAASGGSLLNHSLITATTKDSTVTLTVDVDLTFQDV